MKQAILNNLKNVWGWKTPRKIVVISVDDYGNVRLDSKRAREEMDKAGLKVATRFDAYDALETREDLEQLYDVLTSVKDRNGHHAVFTPFALPCNINFQKMAEENYELYRYELLHETYHKLAATDVTAYAGAWQLWQEGIKRGLMVPQFHGREHFNLKVFEEKLSNRDFELMTSLGNRSLASISSTAYKNIGWTAAFAYYRMEETKQFPEILRSGSDAFEQVFGFRPKSFTPPAQQFPQHLEATLSQFGIMHLDKPFLRKRHIAEGKYQSEFNVSGYDADLGLDILVRNVVFEPTEGIIDHVKKALGQVEAAFRWNKPANISSHRVNFCGHIEPKNREKGLNALKSLLGAIVRKWPEVEFMSASELGDLIRQSRRN